MSHDRDQKRFVEVAADWHEPMIPRHIVQQSSQWVTLPTERH